MKNSIKSIVLSAVITLIFAAGIAFYVFSKIPPKVYADYSFSDRNGIICSEHVESGTVISVPQPDIPDGYVFAGWKDIDGNIINVDELTVENDCSYYPVFRIAPEEDKHEPYLFSDKNGFFHPAEGLTRSDAARLFYSILDDPDTSGENFSDVKKKDSFAEAALAVKNAGIIKGSSLYPDRTVSRSELIEMAAAAFPYSSDPMLIRENAENPDDVITRYETADFINNLIGREPDEEYIENLTGVIPDANLNNEFYFDFVEASVGHELEKSDFAEKWNSNDKYAVLDEGFNTIDGKMYYMNSDGTIAVDTMVGNFCFDENGCYTSGNTELDKLVREIIEQVTTNEMTDLEKLKAVYDYTVKTFSYRKGELYAIAETGWSSDEAYNMISTGKGNCYSFAATFAELAKALGFDATAYSGTCSGENYKPTPHGWVELSYEDVIYVCDPELEYRSWGSKDMFMMEIDSPRCTRWLYNRIPEEDADIKQ